MGQTLARLKNLMSAFEDEFDLVLIDTQGARSVMLEMALLCSDMAISPITPDMLAAREFYRGTQQLLRIWSRCQFAAGRSRRKPVCHESDFLLAGQGGSLGWLIVASRPQPNQARRPAGTVVVN